MFKDKIRELFPVMTSVALRAVGAAVCFYLAACDVPVIGHVPPQAWAFIAAVQLAQVIEILARRDIIRRIGELATQLSALLLFVYVADHTGNPAFMAVSVLVFAYVVAGLFGHDPGSLTSRLLDRVFTNDSMRMPKGDLVFWRACLNIRDLGKAGAMYLEGKLKSQPGAAPLTPVDDETAPILPALIAANRAGFFTTGSQPGGMCQEWPRQAYVIGFADLRAMRALHELLTNEPRLAWRIRRTFEWWDRAAAGETIHFGVLRRGTVEGTYGDVCSEPAVVALVNGYQIVIEDPQSGRDDVLWPLLERFASLTSNPTRKG